MNINKKLSWVAALMVLVLPLAFMADNTGAMYLPDASKEIAAGLYANPQDGVCVVGIGLPGTVNAGILDINTSITNYKDCITYTTSSIKLLGKTACNGGAGNDGFRHTYSEAGGSGQPPQLCLDSSGNPISRVDLDNTLAMCYSKGGTALTLASPNGKCVAYGWQYMNVKPAELIPYRSTIIPSGYKGRTSADKLGFCYAAMRMTSLYGSSASCPSYHNDPALAGSSEWPACLSSATGCQTQASYDAGLGWSFSSSQCVYAYGIKGYLNAALTNAAGATATVPLCAGGTGSATAGTCVDLSGYTSQGDCLANGGSWDNWLPYGDGTGTGGNASTIPVATTPIASSIVKLDAVTPVADGGGNYYSGTGSVCLKCHSDQSRAYMERTKPGFVETPHKKAGDMSGPWQEHFLADASDWGLKGVQCTMCHSTARPANDDLIQITPAGLPGAGNPISATGHNRTEYGSYVTDVCFTCHGHFPSSNAASVIPVSAGDFALTPKGLPPVANQFLNSPHAKYWGTTSSKLDIGNRNNYASTFAGYICRTGLTTVSGTWTSITCPGAGHTWTQPSGASAAGCYYNSTSCAAAGWTWNSTFDTSMYPINNGGVCSGVGAGSILTTVFRSGEAQKIPNVDSASNPVCSNYGNGTATSGASGFWVRDGEYNTGAVPLTSDQGSCMTCHDVHWDFDSTTPGAEPIRRECTTCHMNPGTSATGAPQATSFNHPAGAETPLEDLDTHPYESCEICHMPFSSETGMRMHLWRINTDSAYETMGTTQANTAPDGPYTNAAWVDIDKSCGQCHKASGAAYAFSKAQLAGAAKGMHSGGTASNSECLSCHSSGAGGAPIITPGTNHHGLYSSCVGCHPTGHNSPLPNKYLNSFCLGCHQGANHHAISTVTAKCVSCHTIPGVTVPPMTTRDQITAGCLSCHNSPQGTKKAIVPSSTYGIDNHHRGSSTKHFTTTTNDYGCKGCHGSGKSTLAATGLSGTPFCAECHTVVQTGAGKDHHEGVCLNCHKVNGAYSGTFGAGVSSGQVPECLYCHDGVTRTSTNSANVPGPGPISQGINHHLGECKECHGELGGVAAIPNWSAADTRDEIVVGCLTCHSDPLKSGGLAAIIPKAQMYGNATDTDNHHRGHDSLDAGLVQGKSCLACHGLKGGLPTVKATGKSGNDLCAVCHTVVQSGPTQDHHRGTCTGCHHTDGSFSGTYGAGVTSGQTADCLVCHSTTAPKALITHPTKPVDPTCQNCHAEGGYKPTFAAACNSCHGGSAGPTAAVRPAPYLTAAKLAKSAPVMHKNVAPKAIMTLIATDTAATTGIQVKVGAAVQVKDDSTDANGNLATIIVAWGDGKSVTIAPGATTPVKTYTKTGNITITLTAIDGKGLKSTTTSKITVVR